MEQGNILKWSFVALLGQLGTVGSGLFEVRIEL